MKLNLTIEQILTLVKQLPPDQKKELAQELEKEGIDERFFDLLNHARENPEWHEFSAEADFIRRKLYEKLCQLKGGK
ncbi:hypothetical protein [Chitinophaga japonensis]|uniref:Uncharacterized protein n=1 Tax=Chitinophaga japonensis TaxID=104662 RepID=A0A562T437_CHIJA|nr:hypothetical protein [Chitinophaga japonensis]TWI87826.1 hypothetical protein LX66_1897 [Chitinophaga japonensis]